jgi:hypothetical protein
VLKIYLFSAGVFDERETLVGEGDDEILKHRSFAQKILLLLRELHVRMQRRIRKVN